MPVSPTTPAPIPPAKPPILHRYRSGVSFVLGVAVIALAGLLGMHGHDQAAGFFLFAGLGLVYHALGWPTVPELLSGRRGKDQPPDSS